MSSRAGKAGSPPPDDLGLHMVEGDGDTGGLALHYIHDVWLVQHGGRLLQGRACRQEGWLSAGPDIRPLAPTALGTLPSPRELHFFIDEEAEA